MSKRKRGLSRAERQVIGKELRRVHASLTTAMVEANAYGRGNRRIQRIQGRARTAINALMTIRSELGDSWQSITQIGRFRTTTGRRRWKNCRPCWQRSGPASNRSRHHHD